jgi:putative SOS response-associated peptidase YedK
VCGRFTLSDPGRAFGEFSILEKRLELPPRFNVSPSHEVAIVRIVPPETKPRADMVSWGFPPPAGAERTAPLINARAETAAKKATFAAAFRERRCLVLADGFYEWKRSSGQSQPFLVRRADGKPFAMAGLWTTTGKGPDACTILTRPPVSTVAELHDRMPAILERPTFETWLDPKNHDTDALLALLLSPLAFELSTVAVSTRVNKPENDDRSLIEPVPETGGQLDLFPRKR